MSGSIPDPRREPEYFGTADLAAIREALLAIAVVTLKRGRLVFGGHPAVSPLILMTAKSLHAVNQVEIFQSEFFRNDAPEESHLFQRVKWTPAVGGERNASVLAMRKEMVERSGGFEAGFFVGGMEGVEEEFELFRARWPDVPVFPVGSTGAAALKLLNRSRPALPFLSEESVRSLREDLVYPPLFERLLAQE